MRMKFKTHPLGPFGCSLILTAASSAVVDADVGASSNRYSAYPAVANRLEGTAWPKGQALPTFATPAMALDTIEVQALSKEEQITFSALQGLVNRKQPRILLVNRRAEEGRDTWANTATVGIQVGKSYGRGSKYELVAKYAAELRGVVLYDPAKSPHYHNLAGTAAGIRSALPVTRDVLNQLQDHGIALEVLEDLTQLPISTPLEIYQHLYEHYWPKCEKRLILSAKPHDERGGGDYHHTRDLAAATGSAVVWLNTLIPDERNLLRKFFGDMKAGEAIALGWYTTERSGIPTASEFGIGTLPSDHFMNATVFSGTAQPIQIPPVPKLPQLENKVYLAVIISDGDNIQYTQHAMRNSWDRTAALRGKFALNWTLAPGLVDIAPGIINYYYTTATAADCFVTGPSGMGYLMPYNTLTEPGAPVGDKLTDPVRMDGYAKLTETYLQRSGMRVITIWDDATPMQRQAYERHGRQLYGATVQNFKDVPAVASSVENHRVRFDRLIIPYAGSLEHIGGSLEREIGRWNGKSPLFLSYQVDAWSQLKPAKLLELRDKLNVNFPGKVEFVRADHYFNLFNQANGLPFNLCLAATTRVRAAEGETNLAAVTDGTPTTLWTSTAAKGSQWLTFEFDQPYQVSRCLIRHAGDHGLAAAMNTRAFSVQVSSDAKSWKTIEGCQGNPHNVTDLEFQPLRTQHMRILMDDPGEDGTARISDVEIYGSR
jgi:hypothetical protein